MQLCGTNDILKMIKDAMKEVDRCYYSISCAKMASPKLRERTYCYELYHQMRILQDKNKDNTNFDIMTIHGEIDKRGGGAVPQKFNPDFVFHVPGKMYKNLVVVEVKVNWDKEKVKKDFTTLCTMIYLYGYQTGVFVLVGKNQSYVNRYINKDKLNYLYSEIGDLSRVDNKIYILTQTYLDNGTSIVYCKTLREIHNS